MCAKRSWRLLAGEPLIQRGESSRSKPERVLRIESCAREVTERVKRRQRVGRPLRERSLLSDRAPRDNGDAGRSSEYEEAKTTLH